MFEKAAVRSYFQEKEGLQSFLIHSDHDAFRVIVKMGVLIGIDARHQMSFLRMPEGVKVFQEAVSHNSQGNLLLHSPISINSKVP